MTRVLETVAIGITITAALIRLISDIFRAWRVAATKKLRK